MAEIHFSKILTYFFFKRFSCRLSEPGQLLRRLLQRLFGLVYLFAECSQPFLGLFLLLKLFFDLIAAFEYIPDGPAVFCLQSVYQVQPLLGLLNLVW